jgi:hypothetical protein
MLRALLFIAVPWMLTACATEPVTIRRYSSDISAADVQQLKLLVRSDPNRDHRLAQLEAIGSDRVRVKVGGPNRGREGSRYTILVAMKRGGRWMFDPKAPVEGEAVVITH